MQETKTTDIDIHRSDFLDDNAIRRILRKTAEDIAPVDEPVFSRIKKNISDTSNYANQKKSPLSKTIRKLKDYLHYFFIHPQFAWGVVAVQAVVLCVFFASASQQTSYRTLSADQSASHSVAPALYVIFENSATIEDIKQLLTRTGGTIINGPANRSVYTIQFQEATPEQMQVIIRILQQSPLITFTGNVF